MTRNKQKRIYGLDLARCIALLGMVLVNFRLAMVESSARPSGWLFSIISALEGKASALFVILAGIGLGISTTDIDWSAAQKKIFPRAIFLFLIGMLNVAIFPADIIHYYAVYFLLAALCLKLPSPLLLLLIPLLSLTSVFLIDTFNFNTGWNWQTLTYSDFWTFHGFMRNLWFNGFHPVLPWLAFLIFGIYLSRLSLNTKRVQRCLLYLGLSAGLLSVLLSSQLTPYLNNHSLGWIFATSPVPPTPFYLIAAGGFATATIGLCLLLYQNFPHVRAINWLIPAGRQTLTLYIFHIILAMGTLEYLGWLYGQSLSRAVLTALIYFFSAAVFANIWAKYFRYGLLESVLAGVSKRI